MADKNGRVKPVNIICYPRKKFKKLALGYCKYKGIKSTSDFMSQLLESFFLPFPPHELDRFMKMAEEESKNEKQCKD